MFHHGKVISVVIWQGDDAGVKSNEKTAVEEVLFIVMFHDLTLLTLVMKYLIMCKVTSSGVLRT